MLIDLPRGELHPLTKIAQQLPGRNRKGRHIATLHRWADFGINGVYLRVESVGGIRYSTVEWTETFLAGVARGKTKQPRRRSTRPHGQSHEEAVAALRKMGVMR